MTENRISLHRARAAHKSKRKLSSESLENRVLLASDVVISEFMAVNTSSLRDDDGQFSDWIEISNRSDGSVDLNGWYLSDNDNNLTKWEFPAVSLPQGGVIVVYASDNDRTNPEAPLHTNFRLASAGEFLALVEPDGSTIATAFSPEYPAQSADVSYGFSADGLRAGYFTSPTPGARNNEPEADPARQVIFTEIMYHPSSEESAEEFIELHNTSNEAINLDGWRLSGGLDYSFTDFSIPSEGFAVVVADPAAFRAKYGNDIRVAGPWSGRLSNSTDRITLRNGDDLRVDQVAYADEGDWALRELGPEDRGTRGWIWADDHDGGGKSLELVNRSLPNEFGQNWSASVTSQGTPGALNSVDSSNAAPFILDVQHSPAIPHSDEPVVVTAQIVSREPLTSVELFASVGGADFSSLSMRDDGLGGDAVAFDGVYSVMLPALPDLTVVEFYVSATADRTTRNWPAPVKDGGQDANALYQVVDAFDLLQISEQGVPTYFEVMTEEDRATFTAINRRSDAEMTATFISVDNEGIKVRYNAGIRIRGSGSRNDTPPNNRINIPSDNPWNGITAFNLNVDTIEDQIAGSALFRAYGLPAAEAKAVRMYSNGINLRSGNGFYAYLEPLNSEFAENQFPLDSNGNVYKGRRSNESPPGGLGAGLAYHGPDPEPYVSYIKLSNSGEADYSDIIRLTDVLNNAPDETFIEEASAIIDIEQWIEFFAMNALIGNTEGGLVNGDRQGDDYAMYRGIVDPRFQMVPHDLDSILSNRTWPLSRWSRVPALNRLLNHPEIKPLYYETVQSILNDFLLTERAQLAIRQALEPLGQSVINSALNYLVSRGDYVNSTLLREANTIDTVYPTDGDLILADRDSTALHGVSHYAASSVTVNGHLASHSTNTNTWELGSRIRTLVSRSVEWQYLDDGSDQGNAWYEPGFVPSDAWKLGAPQFGYGDGDERTELSFGEDPNNKHITTYFRHEFELTEAWRYYDLNLLILRDDGVAVYVNGTEVHRDNLPNDASFDTPATQEVTGNSERTTRSYSVDPSLLIDGTNVVAIELHQASRDSADVSLTAYMTGRRIEGTGIPLNPGINRLVVESHSGPFGTGDVLATTELDFWYDDGDVTEVAGVLPIGDTAWNAADGPFYVTGDVTIPLASKLTIEPGTTVYFAEGTEMIVNGTLVARGNPDNRIRLTSDPTAANVPNRPLGRETFPDGPPRWKGIHFSDSMSPENSVAFADIEYAQDTGGSIGVVNSAALIDNVTFSGTHLRMIFGNNASMIVQNSKFPDMFPGDEDPAELELDNVAEHVKIIGRTPAGGVLRIENNTFGTNKGHNDVIDADSNQVAEGPILQIIGNTFDGAGDELLDLGGDVFVYGNVFRNVFKDTSTSDRGYANAISTGDSGSNTVIVVAKNVFYEIDHAINLKRNAATIFEYNTVAHVHPDFIDRFDNPNIGSVVNLYVDEPGASPGRGAYVANNILWDVPRVFGNADLPAVTSVLQANHNLIVADDLRIADRPGTVLSLGAGNRIGDPRFLDVDNLDFRLQDGSAALSVEGEAELGWLAPSIEISGEPSSPSNGLFTSLTVGGPGIFSYQYRVNGGPWSEEIPIGSGFDPAGTVRKGQIILASLPDGEYTVEVRGRDFAGNWQSTITPSDTWTVQRGKPSVQINEILADNRGAHLLDGTAPDVIELINNGTSPIDLNGYSLSDRADQPDKFTFDSPTVLQPGEFVVLYADTALNELPGSHLGFSINSDGEGIYLFAPTAPGEAADIVDSVEFGNQLINMSIGRVGQDRSWALTAPTIGSTNRRAMTGAAQAVRINEWLAVDATQDDFVELYNNDSFPVNIGGYSISDEIGGDPNRNVLPPLTFIAGMGFLDLTADNSSRVNHLNFTLSADQEVLGLIAPSGQVVDSILYVSPIPGRSEGRLPDGSGTLDTMSPTPGYANGGGIPGDVNNDERVDIADVEMQCSAVRVGSNDNAFDLNRDGTVDRRDMTTLIVDILNTSFGDSNVDGIFNSSDLVLVFTAGEYEDGIRGNSTWIDGDWNCDGDFGTQDLVVAFQNGRYTTAAIPEFEHDLAAAHDRAIDQLTSEAEQPKHRRNRGDRVWSPTHSAVQSLGVKRFLEAQPVDVLNKLDDRVSEKPNLVRPRDDSDVYAD